MTGFAWVHATSDGLLALAFYAVPLLLLRIVGPRPEPSLRRTALVVGAFALACGTMHLAQLWTVWIPGEGPPAAAKVVTAIMALATAAVLVPLVPDAAALPSPAAHRRLAEKLWLADAERARAEDALSRCAEELAQNRRDLDEFAYIASHDLREPLRAIQTYAAFVLEDCGERVDPESRKNLEALPRLTRRMEEQIDALLQCSRIGAAFDVRRTDVHDVAALAIQSLRPWLDERAVDVRLPTRLPDVRCDATHVRELFRRLVTNAVQYNDKPDPRVEIGWAANAAQEPVFYVRDNGIGIRAQHQESIFRLFKRLHAREKFGGGMGVGLTIAKKIVERHGGRIWVESTWGQGTTFHFTLGGGHGNLDATDSTGGGQPVGLRDRGSGLDASGARQPDSPV